MRISGVQNANFLYGKIASGRRIQSAADDAAGLAIANKLKRNSNGLDVGASNINDGIGVANIKEGALGTMQESLQRIRELSLKASNGLYGDSEKSMIQGEIDQLLSDIQHTAVGTQYNEMQLLDGSMADMNIATNADGSGLKIQMENATLKSLGLEGYNVTGEFDIGVIDSAMEKISASRSRLGASTNALEHAYNYNTGASLNLTASRSRIEDLDMPMAISEQKKNKLLEDYRMGMLRKKMQNDSMVTRLFGM
ncbi:MAG: flagellin [Lachnospiraceae bacterium]|nr:flagellin [Lachnospiraceae bacterium]